VRLSYLRDGPKSRHYQPDSRGEPATRSEQFPAKVIRLAPGHRAKLEEKPEVKKAGGVYHTTSRVVEYTFE
jgi:hypothetical protein